MKRTGPRRDGGGTYIQPKGTEQYRGHLLEKALVSLAGRQFWRVDVKPIGCATTGSYAFLQTPVEGASLAKVVGEAKALVGHMIHEGAGVPATAVSERHMADKPLDRIIMKSATGKASVCLKHWRMIESGAKAGAVNALVANIILIQRFTDRMHADGLLVGDERQVRDGFTMNMLLDSYAPLCCWLGDDEFAKILADSDPKLLLDRARAKGLL